LDYDADPDALFDSNRTFRVQLAAFERHRGERSA
jgi:hypothetical protein